jgi:hypothetical protein
MRSKIPHALSLALFWSGIAWADTALKLPPEARYILPLAAGPDLLHQCSRLVPPQITGYWIPTEAQIDEFEKQLHKKLSGTTATKAPPANLAYHRQYIGVVSFGKRLIYGNFYPGRGDATRSEATTPSVVCDGGEAFWGAVFDAEKKNIISIDFNGHA